MFKPKNKRVIVELESTTDKNINIGGKDYILDTAFRKLWNAVQHVIVVSRDKGCDVKPGDKVYVHHFVVEDERKVPTKGKDYRWLEYSQLYCRVRKGKIKTLSDYILVEPIQYDESKFKKSTDSGILLTRKAGTEYVDKVGTVKYIGRSARRKGLRVGDKILFNKNCEYQIKIEGEVLYRMEMRDVITVLDKNTEFTVK